VRSDRYRKHVRKNAPTMGIDGMVQVANTQIPSHSAHQPRNAHQFRGLAAERTAHEKAHARDWPEMVAEIALNRVYIS
jgi:hypothetical protein